MIGQNAIGQKIKMLHPTAHLNSLSKQSRFLGDVKEPSSVVNVGRHKINKISIDGALSHRT